MPRKQPPEAPAPKKKPGPKPRVDGWTQAALAIEMGKRFGRSFSDSAVQKWARAGAPMDDVDALEAWYRTNRLEVKGSAAADCRELRIKKLQADVRLKRANAERAEHQLRMERARCLDRDSVDRAFAQHREDAARLLGALPDQIAAVIVDNPDHAELAGLRAIVKRETAKAVKGVMRILSRTATA